MTGSERIAAVIMIAAGACLAMAGLLILAELLVRIV
jgi:hypothetical protein